MFCKLPLKFLGPLPLLKLVGAVAAAFGSCINIQTSVFGVYDYGLPPLPSNWALVDMTCLEFLMQNSLLVLEDFTRFVIQQQGYVSLDVASAFYMLWWVHPEMVANSKGKPWVFLLSQDTSQLQLTRNLRLALFNWAG
ncbi:hypothetical protein B5M09_004117 [Aphanomyces astaci]|uniref:Uncharacterized protein n=1 Tax=Aphanomyces astaci TaxID=112090 RepID=A0A425D2L5_APHAT|nr:hypothetical protein B5M09_004117 [Aphanomyces astaci]